MKHITIRSIMNPGLKTVSPDDTVQQAAEFMCQHGFGAAIIGTPENMLGVFSERDLLNKVVGQGKQPTEVLVRDVMTTSLLTIGQDESLDRAIQIMESKGIRHLPVVDEDGVAVGMLGMRDLMTNTVEQLEEENQALNQLAQLKDEFLANTSHELRTPLNGIIGIAESMVDGATGQLTPKQLYNLSLIISSGRRLANLVNDILDFSKLKHKKLDLYLKPIALKPLVDVVLTILFHLTQDKPLVLNNAVDSELPAVQADENRLQQILYNLIGNAIKFTEAGEVKVMAEVIGEHLRVEVQDTGAGIPADKHHSIFESFEQGDGDGARQHGGTGIGLAITRQLIELHGGEIGLDSEVGQGSSFYFTLPISDQNPSQFHAREEIAQIHYSPDDEIYEPESELPSKHQAYKILVVDDERINAQVLANLLSLENYSIYQATSGQEALDALATGEVFDLILLDIMMPKMTGYEVCQRIREYYPATELPVVMLTAKNQVADLVQSFNMGANDYLTKPFSRNELKARIKTHLELAKINMAYSRFVPREFLSFLGYESIVDVNLGDQVLKRMTVLFSDIRSFTSLSESMSPEDNFNFLNSYLRRVSPVIREHGGFIDKYIGDAIMALFPSEAEAALQAALGMLEVIRDYNPSRIARGYQPIKIGFGIHTGQLMLGTIGENQRMEGTVISDAVNLCSRLEGLSKTYGASIIISEQVLWELRNPQAYMMRYLGVVKVTGRNVRTSIFEVYNGEEEPIQALKTETKPLFEEGIQGFYARQYEKAFACFEQVLKTNPEDKAAELYGQLIDHILTYDLQDEALEQLNTLTSKV